MVKILLGKELGLKNKVIETLKKDFFKSNNYDKHIYIGNMDTLSDLLQEADNGGMFVVFKLILFYEFEYVKNDADLKNVKRLVDEKSDETLIIFISSENKHPISNKYLKDDSLTVSIFYELNESKKFEFISNFFKKNKFSISEKCMSLLSSNLDNNTSIIESECEKLMFYKHEEKTINEHDVLNLVEASKQEDPFGLFLHLSNKSLSKCLITISNLHLYTQGDTVEFLGGFMWQFSKLESVVSKTEDGQKLEASLISEGLRFQIQQESYKNFIKNYSPAHIRKSISKLHDINLLSRKEPEYFKMYLEFFVLETIFDKKDSFFMNEKLKLFDEV